ncbi:hypothetical protein [uncultured Dokdonia sp.]|uniref:hypothetical protein n=1 Tax=uncultured Dokdonia sp. TaxID=575653 RepID=UPI00260F8E4A|nr:hypothetical protein [uncultured Dokdonia sp.]
MKLSLIALLLLIHVTSFAQSVQDYQYVIIPEKYDFAKNIDEYQLNSLTQFLFNKYGFEAYKERDEKPFGFEYGSCDALYADVESDSNFLVARLKVVLKDCEGQVVFTSEQGKSKEKDFKRAYHEALRKAFISIEELEYTYNGTSHEDTKSDETVTSKKPEIKIVEEQIKPKQEEAVKEIEEQVIVQIKEMSSITGSYQSADGFYTLVVTEDNLTIFEGTQKIGTAITNDNKMYEVLTTQFSGKGYFKNNTFIVDRVVKGIGVVQMIFSKSE